MNVVYSYPTLSENVLLPGDRLVDSLVELVWQVSFCMNALTTWGVMVFISGTGIYAFLYLVYGKEIKED